MLHLRRAATSVVCLPVVRDWRRLKRVVVCGLAELWGPAELADAVANVITRLECGDVEVKCVLRSQNRCLLEEMGGVVGYGNVLRYQLLSIGCEVEVEWDVEWGSSIEHLCTENCFSYLCCWRQWSRC